MPWPIPGTGLVIAIIALTLLGFLTANLVGRTLVELGEGVLSRMPIVRPIYKTMKQIFETLFSKTGSSFRQVALVEFPAPAMWSLVFVSQPPNADLGRTAAGRRARLGLSAVHAEPDHRLLLFRAAQEPGRCSTSSVENAMTLLISAGMVQPNNDPQKRLASMAANARAAQLAQQSVKSPAAAAE